jgi:GNAT superfamily N-acetyltransferase
VHRIRSVRTDDPIAAALLDEYFTSREQGFVTHADGYRRVPPDPVWFVPPAGDFLVLELEGKPVGSGGVRMLDRDRAEIKHLWVRPEARGSGLGLALLAALERRAVDLGAATAVLDTNETLATAQRIYRGTGYVEIEPYNDNRNATHWFAKRLIPE